MIIEFNVCRAVENESFVGFKALFRSMAYKISDGALAAWQRLHNFLPSCVRPLSILIPFLVVVVRLTTK